MNSLSHICVSKVLKQPNSIVLSPFSASHLGDILCMSPIPRLLTFHRGMKVYVARSPHTREVFQNNPYVLGMVRASTLSTSDATNGSGHIIQRLQQGLELPVDPVPRPEIYLTEEEKRWAMKQRAKWPTGRPVCILSCGAISDGGNVKQVNWQRVVTGLARRYTVIQPLLRERRMRNAIIYKDLPLRRFMALFSVVDCFVGGTSGGSHLAAAFGVPSIIVIWQSLKRILEFPVSSQGFKASFLYPYHWFIASEQLARDNFRGEVLEHLLNEVALYGRQGRPTSFGNNPRHPSGFVLTPPPKVINTSSGRFVRAPVEYPTYQAQFADEQDHVI